MMRKYYNAEDKEKNLNNCNSKKIKIKCNKKNKNFLNKLN